MSNPILVSICILILIILIMLLWWSKREPYSPMVVDVVYLWVDSNDPEREFNEKLEKLQKNDQNSEDKRYRNNEELRYSLRSLDMYCPWVRKIFIVVKDGQKPAFVNFQNPKIQLINHSQIIPKHYLPLFNSISIELFIHKIPDLSSHYIYMNDDMMILKPMKASDFFPNGKPVININLKENYRRIHGKIPVLPYKFRYLYAYNLELCQKLFSTNKVYQQFHTPSPCYKPWEEELEALLKRKNLYQVTRFRTNHNVLVNNLLRNYFYETKNCPVVCWDDGYTEIKPENGENNFINFSTCNIPHITFFFTLFKKFLCVNDISLECKQNYLDFMEKLFPYSSSLEMPN